MATGFAPVTTPIQMPHMAEGLIFQQALYAAAKLGVADLLIDGPRAISELAGQLGVNESALCRLMRLLASRSVFEETSTGTFRNSDLSQVLREGVPGSIRSLLLFWGSEFFFAPFGEILYSIQTGQPAREKLFGANTFEYLKDQPQMARVVDDAMTNISQAMGPPVSSAYDFGAWGSLMDVGGGNGIFLAAILRAHPQLLGVLADLPHVIERARQKGFLGGELEERSSMQACDFFSTVPSGCRAYLMKHVIHDWDDERAHKILLNCRRAVPNDGVLLLVEYDLPEGNLPSQGKLVDVIMLVMNGGKERSIQQYRELLAGAGFRLNRVVPVPGDLCIIESTPI